MIARMFLDHPRSVGESYARHFLFALRFSGALFQAAFAALIHAFVPCLFERTASRAVARLHAATAARGTGISAARCPTEGG
ncbi:MAG: hypothetical protein D6688_12965 [Alphaproteobacteria bacterium]|nr:MAG: hypothetical protein D6688_12965 [Alphaproteobacteria bacterium]